jgi:hypothetical protein
MWLISYSVTLLASLKHSSLFGLSVSYRENEVLILNTVTKLYFPHNFRTKLINHRVTLHYGKNVT